MSSVGAGCSPSEPLLPQILYFRDLSKENGCCCGAVREAGGVFWPFSLVKVRFLVGSFQAQTIKLWFYLLSPRFVKEGAALLCCFLALCCVRVSSSSACSQLSFLPSAGSGEALTHPSAHTGPLVAPGLICASGRYRGK